MEAAARGTHGFKSGRVCGDAEADARPQALALAGA
jgi:hypothetical protein